MKIEINTNLDEVTRKLDQLIREVRSLRLAVVESTQAQLQLGEEVMADLSALQQEVAENTDAVASASALLSSLSQQLRDSAGDPAAVQALADQLDANNQALAQAVVDNTPAGGGGG